MIENKLIKTYLKGIKEDNNGSEYILISFIDGSQLEIIESLDGYGYGNGLILNFTDENGNKQEI